MSEPITNITAKARAWQKMLNHISTLTIYKDLLVTLKAVSRQSPCLPVALNRPNTNFNVRSILYWFSHPLGCFPHPPWSFILAMQTFQHVLSPFLSVSPAMLCGFCLFSCNQSWYITISILVLLLSLLLAQLKLISTIIFTCILWVSFISSDKFRKGNKFQHGDIFHAFLYN